MPFNAAVAYSWCLYQNQNWFRFLKELFPKLTRVNKQGKKKNMEKNKKYIFIGIWKKQKIKKKKGAEGNRNGMVEWRDKKGEAS